MAITLSEAWEKLFPARGEYTGQGFPTPPAGENPPPKGTRWNMYIDGKWYEVESSGTAGIMPHIIREVPAAEAGPPGTGPEEENGTATTWEPFAEAYPQLQLPRYAAYGAQYPFSQLGIYQPFGAAYPELRLPRYERFGEGYPELGELYPQAGDVIGRLLRGEGLALPTEELMEAYTAEEKRALEEYMPELREYWAEKGLLRSGMARGEEEEAITRAATARGTYRAELEKESAIRVQEGIIQGLGLAMQYTGMGYEAQVGAWQAANTEYQREYTSAIQAGLAESEARERGWAAMSQEYVRQFTSSIEATRFAQDIKERSYASAQSEYRKVYDSAVAAGQSEWEAQARAQDAYRAEYARVQTLEFTEWETRFRAEIDIKLAEMGYKAEQRQSIWDAIIKGIGIVAFGTLW